MQKKDKRDQIFEVRLTKADVNWLEKHRRRKKYLGADVGELIQNLVDREVARAKPKPAPGPLLTNVLIPITSPLEFMSGPPEFPGFIAASV